MSEPTPEEVDEACRKLQEMLDRPMTPREGKLIARFDQIRAECGEDQRKREAVIETFVNEGWGNREDAEEWFDGDDDAEDSEAT